jgi:hypothetical protein
MKEAVNIRPETLTNRLQTPYSNGGDIFMAEVGTEAIRAPSAEVAVKTVTPVAENITQTMTPPTAETATEANSLPASGIVPDKVIEVLEGKVENLKKQQTATEKPQENAGKKSESEKIITSDPEYQRIFEEKVKQARVEGKNPDLKTLETETLEEFAQGEIKETQEEVEEQQGNPLTPEQKMEISKEFKNAFKANYREMADITKKTAILVKAKAREIKLQESSRATEEQKARASEAIVKAQEQYDSAIKEIGEKFGNNPRLMKYIRDSSDNSKALDLLQNEKRKALIKIILQLALAIGFSAGVETADDVNPASSKQ